MIDFRSGLPFLATLEMKLSEAYPLRERAGSCVREPQDAGQSTPRSHPAHSLAPAPAIGAAKALLDAPGVLAFAA